MSKELTTGERKTLKQLEATIKHGLASFYEVGNALSAIRDMRLYRSEFKTFEEYCQDRWGFQRHYANRLIASAKVVEDLVPTGTKPESERVAREVAKAPEDKRQEVWQQAIERSGGKPTAAEVKAVVAEICEEEEESEEDDRPTDEEVSIARHALRALISDAIEAWHSGGYLGAIDVKISEVLRELADEFGDD